MFTKSKFNQNISKWDVGNVKYMSGMFANTPFNQDISNWDLSIIEYKQDMLKNTPLEKRLQKLQEQELKVDMNDEDVDNDDEFEIGR